MCLTRTNEYPCWIYRIEEKIHFSRLLGWVIREFTTFNTDVISKTSQWNPTFSKFNIYHTTNNITNTIIWSCSKEPFSWVFVCVYGYPTVLLKHTHKKNWSLFFKSTTKKYYCRSIHSGNFSIGKMVIEFKWIIFSLHNTQNNNRLVIINCDKEI